MSVQKKSQLKSIGIKLCAGGLTVIVAGLVYLQGAPKVYRATAKVKIVKSGWKTNDANFSFGPEKLAEECRIIRSEKILDRVITNLDLNATWGKSSNAVAPASKEQLRQRLNMMLDVHPAGMSFMIEIQSSGNKPEEQSTVVNEVTRVYGDFRQAGREDASRQGFSSLRSRWEAQSEKVEEAQASLNKLAAQFNRERRSAEVQVFDADAVPALEAMEENYLRQSNELAKLKELDKGELKNALASLDSNSVLAGVLPQVVKAKSYLRDMQSTHGADAPETKSATLEVEQLNHKVDGLVTSMMFIRDLDLSSLKASLDKVKANAAKAASATNNAATMAQFAAQDATFARAKEELRKLTDERDTLENEIISNGSISAAMPDAISARIMQLADPSSKPISPDRRIAIGAFVIGGIVMGIGILLVVLLQMKPRGAEEKMV